MQDSCTNGRRLPIGKRLLAMPFREYPYRPGPPSRFSTSVLFPIWSKIYQQETWLILPTLGIVGILVFFLGRKQSPAVTCLPCSQQPRPQSRIFPRTNFYPMLRSGCLDADLATVLLPSPPNSMRILTSQFSAMRTLAD